MPSLASSIQIRGGRPVFAPRRSSAACQLAVHRLADTEARTAPHQRGVVHLPPDDVVLAICRCAVFALNDRTAMNIRAEVEIQAELLAELTGLGLYLEDAIHRVGTAILWERCVASIAYELDDAAAM